MSWVAVAAAAGAVVSSLVSSSAANNASDAQVGATQAGIAEQGRQFDAIQKLLAPYVSAGTGAVGAQGDLLGINGTDAQAKALQALQSSPQFSALSQQGENAILANASATGGLRGGNTQGALAQFRPALLSSLISDQFNRLGSLSSLGQNAAAMTGNAGMNTGNQVTNLLQQQGAALAGNNLAQGRIWSNFAGNAAGLGAYYLNGRQTTQPVGGYGTPGLNSFFFGNGTTGD